jgi:hypothetical protein
MIYVDRNVKIWIFISLCTLMLWTSYYMATSLPSFINITLGLPDFYTGKEWYFAPSFLGIAGRSAGVALGLASALLIWMLKSPFSKVKNLVSLSLFLEVLYSVSLLPSFWSLIVRGIYFLGAAYLLQGIFVVPFLSILAVKVRGYVAGSAGSSFGKWAGLAFAGYVAALWVNVVFRWLDMFSVGGLDFLLSGIIAIGFLDATILMSLVLILAIGSSYYFAKQKWHSAAKWLGLALAALGLHYLIYLVYSYLADALSLAFLIDVWAIPLIGVGLAILRANSKK